SFEETAALAASVLDPDVVVLERIVNFCFHSAIDGIRDASIGGVSEGGDVFVDGLERLVEVLGGASRRKKEKRINTERTESATTESGQAPGAAKEVASGKWRVVRATKEAMDHGLGCGPVYSEQQGFCVGVNSISSTLVSSGS